MRELQRLLVPEAWLNRTLESVTGPWQTLYSYSELLRALEASHDNNFDDSVTGFLVSLAEVQFNKYVLPSLTRAKEQGLSWTQFGKPEDIDQFIAKMKMVFKAFSREGVKTALEYLERLRLHPSREYGLAYEFQTDAIPSRPKSAPDSLFVFFSFQPKLAQTRPVTGAFFKAEGQDYSVIEVATSQALKFSPYSVVLSWISKNKSRVLSVNSISEVDALVNSFLSQLEENGRKIEAVLQSTIEHEFVHLLQFQVYGTGTKLVTQGKDLPPEERPIEFGPSIVTEVNDFILEYGGSVHLSSRWEVEIKGNARGWVRSRFFFTHLRSKNPSQYKKAVLLFGQLLSKKLKTEIEVTP